MFLNLPFDFFLTGNLNLTLASIRLSLETLEQNKLNSTAKPSFSKLSKFSLKPHVFTDLKIHKVSLFKLKNGPRKKSFNKTNLYSIQ